MFTTCRKNLLLPLLAAALMILACFSVHAAPRFVVVLDPGHGGSDSGAVGTFYGVSHYEADLVYKISWYTMQALRRDSDIEVYMTRGENETVSVNDRVPIAMRYRPDLIVSQHLNSEDSGAAVGASVLISSGTWRSYIMEKEKLFGKYVMEELTGLGIAKRFAYVGGMEYRLSEDGTTYPNGRLADYYKIVKDAVRADVPGVIIEHCFISSLSDYQNYLSSDEKLRRIGEADARAIIRYLKDQPEKPVIKDGWVLENGKYYYYDYGTKVVRTLLNIDGDYYYVNQNGERMTGWVRNIKGKAYLFDENGKACKGWYTDPQGNKYYFNSQQAFLYANRIIKNNGKLYACKPDGRIAISEFVTINGKTYYAPSTGVLYRKWHKIRGKWYYFNSTTGVMYQNTSMKTTDNKQVFYFSANGVCLNRKD